jgi:mono/diheme cytochrome c family protein
MRKTLYTTIGLFTLILAACASSATPTSTAPSPAPEVSAPATEIPATESAAAPTQASADAPASEVSFASDVMPIFEKSCNKCHGIDQIKEGLDMTSYEKLMEGSFNGEVVVLGNADESMLVELIAKGKMPKRGDKLTDGQLQIIKDWVNAGAPNN